jgi:hypothetical protein
VKDDLSNVDAIASVVRDADVVVSAYAPPQDNTDAIVGVTEQQIAAVKKAGVYAVEQSFRPFDITPSQYNVMRYSAELGRMDFAETKYRSGWRLRRPICRVC